MKREFRTIKITTAGREALREVADATGERHFGVLDRLLVAERDRLDKQKLKPRIGAARQKPRQ
jgi:hypothetical protein